MCDFIYYDVLYIVVRTHNVFQWLCFENRKLLNVRIFRVSSVCRLHCGLGSLWQWPPNKIIQTLYSTVLSMVQTFSSLFFFRKSPLLGHMLRLRMVAGLFPVLIFTSICWDYHLYNFWNWAKAIKWFKSKFLLPW